MQEEQANTATEAITCPTFSMKYFFCVLPSWFSDDHLCSYFMKGLPEFGVLQSHPDVTLKISIGASSHGGGRRAVEVGLQV